MALTPQERKLLAGVAADDQLEAEHRELVGDAELEVAQREVLAAVTADDPPRLAAAVDRLGALLDAEHAARVAGGPGADADAYVAACAATEEAVRRFNELSGRGVEWLQAYVDVVAAVDAEYVAYVRLPFAARQPPFVEGGWTAASYREHARTDTARRVDAPAVT
jgi:hypothetical protein